LMIVLNLVGSFAADWGAVRSIVSVQAMILLPVIFVLYRGRHDVKRTLALRMPRPAVWLAAIVVALSGWFVTVELTAIQHFFLPFPEDLLKQFEDLFKSLDTMPISSSLLLIAFLPGVCEELLCRGFMLRSFQPRLGTAGSIIFVAIIFGLLHMNPYRLLPTVFLGVLLGLLSVWSGSIFPAMLGHFINNATTYLVQKNEAWFNEIDWLSSSESEMLPVWTILIAGTILGVGLRWLYALRQPDAPSESDFGS
jgi:sodium transport system permease protein